MSTKEWREKNNERLKEYRRKWYRSNKSHAKKKVTERKHGLRAWLDELKASLKCSQCGETHPATLDFHHTDPQQKDGGLAGAISSGWSRERILKEIAKCAVLCANCHRKLHWEEGQ